MTSDPPIEGESEWWYYWQQHEQDIAELYVKLNPGIKFSAAAPVIAQIGHAKDKELARAALKTLRDKLRVIDLPPDASIEAVFMLLLLSERVLE